MEAPADYVQPSEPSTPALRRLLEYWKTKCLNQQLPSRQDIDPAELSFVLPNLFLMDISLTEEPHNRFRFRLFGTELARIHGRDLTGKTFHDAMDQEPADGSVRHAMRLVNERIPLFVSGRVLYLKKDWLAFENCMLPLQNEAGDVNMILGATIYSYPSTRNEGVK